MINFKKIRNHLPNSLVNSLYHFPIALFSNLIFGFPGKNLRVIGVTGTDGKTTTTTLIYHVLKTAGKKVAVISTVSIKIGQNEIDTDLHVTCPSPFILQRLLKKIKDKGIEFVVFEVTSHGLDQKRVFGVNFEIGIITNITHEHLDYHKTLKKYLEAKAKLLRNSKTSIINIEDNFFPILKKSVKGNLVTYGLEKGDFTPKKFSFKTSLPGKFNQLNCLAAISALKTLGIDDQIIKKAVGNFKGVQGRMQLIDEGQDFWVVVDFAHTPNALSNALATLEKTYKPKKLIAVFGCAGLRDKLKRPKMGKIAKTFADMVVLTSEDPRTEKTEKIIDEIARGCFKAGAREGKNLFKIPDRTRALEFALKQAGKADLVGIFGKGHEKSMCFGNTEYPWSDIETTKRLLKKLVRGGDKKND